MSDLDTITVEDTLDDAIKASIAYARGVALEEDEPITIHVCLNGQGGTCPTRKPGGHGCALCQKIIVDQFGHVSYERAQ